MKIKNNEQHGKIGVHVDDSMSTGDDSFVSESKITAKKFIFKETEYSNITFTVLQVEE